MVLISGLRMQASRLGRADDTSWVTCMYLDIGGLVEPYRGVTITTGLRSHFVRLIDPLVGVPAQVQSLIMDIHVNHSAPARPGVRPHLWTRRACSHEEGG